MPAASSSGLKRGRPASQSVRCGKQPIEKGRWAAKGTKPLPEQASVKYVLSLIVVHVCRKVLFIPTEVKVMLYSLGLFFGSLVCDFLPLPNVYMGQRDNVFNVYYVKVSRSSLLLRVGGVSSPLLSCSSLTASACVRWLSVNFVDNSLLCSIWFSSQHQG